MPNTLPLPWSWGQHPLHWACQATTPMSLTVHTMWHVNYISRNTFQERNVSNIDNITQQAQRLSSALEAVQITTYDYKNQQSRINTLPDVTLQGRSLWRGLHVLRRDHQTCPAPLTADSDPLPPRQMRVQRHATVMGYSQRTRCPVHTEAPHSSMNWLDLLSARKQYFNKIITSKRLRLEIQKPIPKGTWKNVRESSDSVRHLAILACKLILLPQQHDPHSERMMNMSSI